jgi:outer membrane receptor for ferrienterochelin and colicin
MSTYPKADPQYQVSPRLGLAYQLGNKAILHFSYGHFFQMPPMYALYQNDDFLVYSPPYSVTMGNSQLKAQKNVEYEVGLWQELINDMGLEITLYYVDIYNLLSAIAITHYNQIPYGLYSNKDYGNTRGLTVKYDYRIGHFSAYVNYTLQYTRGNADNPTQSFNRVGDNQDPITKLIVMSWDQRHTFNVTVGYNKDVWGTTMTGYYNSGTPFTWQPIADSRLYQVNLYPNNSYQPTRYWVDLSAYYRFNLYKGLQLKLTLDAYNLLDRLNENYVNSQTGRAYTAIIQDTDRASQHSNFNTYEDRVHNPSMYSAPRLIKLGLGVEF